MQFRRTLATAAIVLAGLAYAACGTNAAPTPEFTPSPDPTAAATLEATVAATPTRKPEDTPAPTATATATAPPLTPTLPPTPEPTYPPTLTATATATPTATASSTPPQPPTPTATATATPTATQQPAVTNAQIKACIDDLVSITGPTYDPDAGINHTAKVYSCADLLYRALHGKTLEQENFAVHFLSQKEWEELAKKPRYEHILYAGGFNEWDTPDNRAVKDGKGGLYVKASQTPASASFIVAHESGIFKARKIWDFQFREDAVQKIDDIIAWYAGGLEAAGYLNDAAFVKRLEEAGFDEWKLANTDDNKKKIKDFLSERHFFRKDLYFDSNGALQPTYEIPLGNLTPYFMVSEDPSLADTKASFESKGSTTSEQTVKALNKLANMHVKDLPDYLRQIIKASRFDAVVNWSFSILTNPLKLAGSKAFIVEDGVPYDAILLP